MLLIYDKEFSSIVVKTPVVASFDQKWLLNDGGIVYYEKGLKRQGKIFG